MRDMLGSLKLSGAEALFWAWRTRILRTFVQTCSAFVELRIRVSRPYGGGGACLCGDFRAAMESALIEQIESVGTNKT